MHRVVILGLTQDPGPSNLDSSERSNDKELFFAIRVGGIA